METLDLLFVSNSACSLDLCSGINIKNLGHVVLKHYKTEVLPLEISELISSLPRFKIMATYKLSSRDPFLALALNF